MQCPVCGHQNMEDARFCSRCGNPLAITCPVCSAVAEPGARFCSNCGNELASSVDVPTPGEDLSRYLPEELLTKLRSAQAGRAMHGERRTVTMLFADIQGSTSAAEGLDPEDWAEIVNGAFQHLIAPVYRYEGTLARLLGDAVLAFFGAPISHEDDPLRALRAGLEIVDGFDRYRDQVETQWGFPIDVRVGVNTGLVVVGEVGSDLRVEYTALGDAINVASRMESTADPGTVRVTDQTRQLAGGGFEFEELGPIVVKGKAAPVVAHRVVRFLGQDVRQSGHPVVGRDNELSLFDDLRTRLMAGSGWIASVVAEAGVGKTALLQEVYRRAAATAELATRFDEPGELTWMVGASRSYDSGNPFSTVRNLLRRWWSIDGAADPFGRVEEAVAAVGLEDLPDAAAYLGYVGGISLPEAAVDFIDALEPPVLHSRAGETLAAYLNASFSHRPGFVVLEDLHWADTVSLALVDDMMDLTERTPIGLVIAMRPYRNEPTWHVHEVAERDHHHRYHHVDLAALGESDSGELLAALLADSSVPTDTRRRILERADGNPLYIEEIARSVHEAGADTPAVPAGLGAMLTARLDRLDADSRFVVQMASVLGSEFRRDALDALLEGGSGPRSVTDLLRRSILVERGRDSLGFRHALFQEAAYGTILRRTRRELHLRVAQHLMEAEPAGAGAIARHLVEAGDLRLAFPYLIEAGRQATRSMALADAIEHFSTAIENAPDDADPDLIVRAHDGLGEAYSLVPDLSQAAAAYQRLYEYGELTSRPSARVAALNRLAYATASLGADLKQAAIYLEDAKQLAEESGDDLGLAEYHMNACFVASMGGRVGEAAAHDTATVALGEKSGMDWIRLSGLVRAAVNYTGFLDLSQAGAAIDAALEATAAAKMEEGAAVVRGFGEAVVRFVSGEVDEAIEVARGAQPTLDRFSSFYAAMNQRNLGAWMYELGDIEGALGRFVEARRVARKSHQGFVASAAAAGMALVYATAGMEEAIAELRGEALSMLEMPVGGLLASSVWVDLGWANLLTGKREEAVSDFDRGLSASSISQFIERPRLLVGRSLAGVAGDDLAGARSDLADAVVFVEQRALTGFDGLIQMVEGALALAEGRLADAESALTAAHRLALESGRRMRVMTTLLALARLAAAAERTNEADEYVTAAQQVVDTIGLGIADVDLRARFTETWTSRLARDNVGPVQ
jgi:class 3 adenylate cyclase/tetratricopeptide (TPR) repeat protein